MESVLTTLKLRSHRPATAQQLHMKAHPYPAQAWILLHLLACFAAALASQAWAQPEQQLQPSLCLFLSGVATSWANLTTSAAETGCSLDASCSASYPLLILTTGGAAPPYSFLEHVDCDVHPHHEVTECGSMQPVAPSLAHLFVSEIDRPLSTWLPAEEVWVGTRASAETQVCGFANTASYPLLFHPLGVECDTPRRWMCVCTARAATSAPTYAPTPPPTESPTRMPTRMPTDSPTSTPTDSPTTAMPSSAPTGMPTPLPSSAPTAVSNETQVPTVSETFGPTMPAGESFNYSLAPTSRSPTADGFNWTQTPATSSPTEEGNETLQNSPTSSPTFTLRSETLEPTSSPTFALRSETQEPTSSPSFALVSETQGPTSSPTASTTSAVECDASTVTCSFSIPAGALRSFSVREYNFSGSVEYATESIAEEGVEIHSVSFPERLAPRPEPVRVEIDMEADAMSVNLWMTCFSNRAESAWNHVNTQHASGWAVSFERLDGTNGTTLAMESETMPDYLTYGPMEDRFHAIVIGTFEGYVLGATPPCPEVVVGGGEVPQPPTLNANDAQRFAELSAKLHRETWAGCNDLAVTSPCDVCGSDTPWHVTCASLSDLMWMGHHRVLDTIGTDLRDNVRVVRRLQFANLGIRGELPIDTLANFTGLTHIDFSSDPTRPNANVLTLPAGVGCVDIASCRLMGNTCSFEPLPLCDPASIAGGAAAAGDKAKDGSGLFWIMAIPGALLGMAAVVVIARRSSAKLKRVKSFRGLGLASAKGYESDGPAAGMGGGRDAMSRTASDGDVRVVYDHDIDEDERQRMTASDLRKSYRSRRTTGEFSYGLQADTGDVEHDAATAPIKRTKSMRASRGGGGSKTKVKEEDPEHPQGFERFMTSFWSKPATKDKSDAFKASSSVVVSTHGGIDETADDALGVVSFVNPEY